MLGFFHLAEGEVLNEATWCNTRSCVRLAVLSILEAACIEFHWLIQTLSRVEQDHLRIQSRLVPTSKATLANLFLMVTSSKERSKKTKTLDAGTKFREPWDGSHPKKDGQCICPVWRGLEVFHQTSWITKSTTSSRFCPYFSTTNSSFSSTCSFLRSRYPSSFHFWRLDCS